MSMVSASVLSEFNDSTTLIEFPRTGHVPASVFEKPHSITEPSSSGGSPKTFQPPSILFVFRGPNTSSGSGDCLLFVPFPSRGRYQPMGSRAQHNSLKNSVKWENSVLPTSPPSLLALQDANFSLT